MTNCKVSTTSLIANIQWNWIVLDKLVGYKFVPNRKGKCFGGDTPRIDTFIYCVQFLCLSWKLLVSFTQHLFYGFVNRFAHRKIVFLEQWNNSVRQVQQLMFSSIFGSFHWLMLNLWTSLFGPYKSTCLLQLQCTQGLVPGTWSL